MSGRRLALWAALLTTACAAVGHLRPEPCPPARELCLAVFPRTAWRALHEIDATAPLGRKTTMLGLTIGEPATRQLRATLLAVEGPTLFDAIAGPDGVRIVRAAPPFDSPAFAAELIADVRTLFFPPTGAPFEAGCLPDGRAVCRFRTAALGAAEIAVAPDGGGAMRIVDAENRLTKEIEFAAPGPNGFSPRAAIKTPGPLGYSLDLRLLEVETGASTDGAFSP